VPARRAVACSSADAVTPVELAFCSKLSHEARLSRRNVARLLVASRHGIPPCLTTLTGLASALPGVLADRDQRDDGSTMGQSSNTLHEPSDKLGPEIIDRHRAIVSLMEELEAVDWYDQRVAACSDPDLRRILQHNRDEEKEHAAMVLEWLRRKDPAFAKHLKRFLFSDGPIVEHEEK
jgi:ferritin-like protein